MKNSVWITALVAPLASGAAWSQAEPQSPEEEHFFLSEQLTYDDNLFRTAEEDSSSPIDDLRERDDYMNRITAGIGDDMRVGQQVFRLKGRVHDVRFQENDQLDHTAGDARAAWEWSITSALSGTLSADYKRTLADFANSISTERDLVETFGYTGSARYALGPRWSVSAYGRRMETEHDLELRTAENFEADLGRFSIDYTTPSQHAFGLEYRYITAEFPDATPGVDGRSSDYDESAALANLTYTATIRTRLRASFGYVDRNNPTGTEGEYAGNTWRAAIDWTPREKFGMTLEGWHELKSYVDAESEYFIADGMSLSPTWSPIRSISLGLELSWEDQEYIGGGVLPVDSTERVDEVFSALTTFTYTPRDNLQLELSYRASDRDSNRTFRRYDAQVASAMIRWSVM